MAGLSPDAGPGLAVEQIEDRPTPVLRLTGELDIAGVGTLRAALESVPGDVDGIVFDLSALHFMDSSGIAVLLTARERFGRVELRHPPAIVRQVIEMTGLADSLPIVE